MIMIHSRHLALFNLFALTLLTGCGQNFKTPDFLLSAAKNTRAKVQQMSADDVKIPDIPAQAHQPLPTSTNITLTPEQEQQIGLQVQALEFKPFSTAIRLTGRVEAADDLTDHIFPVVPGTAVTIFAQLGQHVKRGQTLALIKSDAVGQTESDLLQATIQNESDIEQAKVELVFSRAAYRREEKLFHDRISAKADLEAARTQYEKDKANLKDLYTKYQATIAVAEGRLSLAGVARGVADRVVRTKQIYPYVIVSADHDGIVISRSINNGELVDPSKELFTLADLSRVWLLGDTYEQDIQKVHIGQSVKLTFDSLPNQIFSGQINYIANALDPQTRTLTIRATIPNSDLILKPEMFAHLKMVVDTRSFLSIPKNAIQRKGDYNFAYVKVRAHQYEERRVEVGMENGEFVQVVKGLKPGEDVVSQGTLALSGAALKIN